MLVHQVARLAGVRSIDVLSVLKGGECDFLWTRKERGKIVIHNGTVAAREVKAYYERHPERLAENG